MPLILIDDYLWNEHVLYMPSTKDDLKQLKIYDAPFNESLSNTIDKKISRNLISYRWYTIATRKYFIENEDEILNYA